MSLCQVASLILSNGFRKMHKCERHATDDEGSNNNAKKTKLWNRHQHINSLFIVLASRPNWRRLNIYSTDNLYRMTADVAKPSSVITFYINLTSLLPWFCSFSCLRRLLGHQPAINACIADLRLGLHAARVVLREYSVQYRTEQYTR